MQYLIHSRSIRFLTWCFTHWLVGDSGQPVSVRHQYQHTDVSVVYAWRSALIDLPGVYGRRSSSRSMSLAYIIMNVRISTASNIPSGTSFNFYSINITTTTQTKAVWYHTYGKWCEGRQFPENFLFFFSGNVPVKKILGIFFC